MIDREQVLHVARLARLKLSEEEVQRMSGELSTILDHIEKINELDLDSYRGRSTLPYIAQAAEHFTRRQLGLTAVDAIAGVHRSADHAEVELRDGGVIRVEVKRILTPAPTPLTCKGPSDVSYPTYRLVDLSRIR